MILRCNALIDLRCVTHSAAVSGVRVLTRNKLPRWLDSEKGFRASSSLGTIVNAVHLQQTVSEA